VFSATRKAVTVVLAVTFWTMIACSSNEAPETPPRKTIWDIDTAIIPTVSPVPTAIPTPVAEVETTPRPLPKAADLTAKVQAGVGIVRDTRVKYHDADTIGITLLVDTSGRQEPARRAGDEAVRMVKAMVEGGVTNTIGAGAWEYIVVIFEPGEADPFVVGAKRREADSIDWDPSATATSSDPTPVQASRQLTLSDMVLPTIKSYDLVRNAEIRRDGNRFDLVLLVDYAIDPNYAREIGDSFVRLTKSMLQDGETGEAIGRGEYDYVIHIYYPNNKQVAIGAKASVARKITWN